MPKTVKNRRHACCPTKIHILGFWWKPLQLVVPKIWCRCRRCDIDGKSVTYLARCWLVSYPFDINGAGTLQFINPPFILIVSYSILHYWASTQISLDCVALYGISTAYSYQKMGLSAEAIIGLVALVVTCSPTSLLVYSWFSRRNRGSQGRGLTSQHLLSSERSSNTRAEIANQDSKVQQLGRGQSIPRCPIKGISPQSDKTVVLNYGLYIFGGLILIGTLLTVATHSRSHIFSHWVSMSCLTKGSYDQLSTI